MAASDLHLREGGRRPDTEKSGGGGGGLKNFFPALRASDWSKNKREGGAFPGSSAELKDRQQKVPLKLQGDSFAF